MIAFADAEFALSLPQSDGQPLRVHLESIERQTGRRPSQLCEKPDLPFLASHVWNMFLVLHEHRLNGEQISLASIRDLIALMNFPLEQWEISAIWKLDSLWMKMKNEHN